MENQKNDGSGRKFDVLDKWLKQTLHLDSNQKTQQTASTNKQANLNSSSNSNANKQVYHHKSVQNQNFSKKSQYGSTHHNKSGASQKYDHSYGQSKNKNWGRKSERDNKKNSGSKQNNGNFTGGDRWNRGHFNQRHKFQSALRRATQAGQNPLISNPKGVLRIVPIGGLDEVGKNTMVMEYEDSIFLIDLGFQFPEADMLGVDYVIPDITYLQNRINKVKGIVITHGHLDHIGAIPYLLPKLGFPPIYAGKLAMGLVKKQLEEHGLLNQVDLRTLNFTETLHFGMMQVSFFRVTHSIPDACGLFIETPAGNILHTGDFKIDLSPAGAQLPPDFLRIVSFSQKKITIMMSDSTNATKPGFTISEKKIGITLNKIIKDATSRIIIASFSSQIARVQQIIDAAVKYHKKIYLSGRSLINNVAMAREIGYLKFPQGMIIDIRKSKKHPHDNAIILTTGSQGEPVSALSIMALNEHSQVKINKGDTVILSSSPIPGNEMAVIRVINNLVRLGAKVIHNQIMDVHASGHGQQEDLKLMFSLVKPKYFVPIHGEYYMRKTHGDLMVDDLNHPADKMLMIDNGDILEMKNNEVKISSEKTENKYILIDGMGRGDIGSQVMMDRQILAENGVIVLICKIDRVTKILHSTVDVETRGFIYMNESEEILSGIKVRAQAALGVFIKQKSNGINPEELKLYLRKIIDQFVLSKIDRQPLIIPMIVVI